MRYKLTAKVEGNIFISQAVSVDDADNTFKFLSDDNGKLISVSAIKPVPNNKINNFRQSVIPGIGIAKLNISIGEDEELHAELVKALQTVESNLAFSTRGS